MLALNLGADAGALVGVAAEIGVSQPRYPPNERQWRELITTYQLIPAPASTACPPGGRYGRALCPLDGHNQACVLVHHVHHSCGVEHPITSLWGYGPPLRSGGMAIDPHRRT